MQFKLLPFTVLGVVTSNVFGVAGGDTFLRLCYQLGTNSIQKQVKKGKYPRTYRILAY